ncbi:histidine kinase [Glycomyces sp. NPDC046736]|uniref:sensor histidine kinase n=1 Tax=Glycomyces sp. NPDC046736 TaxID=3155615 RepID=UPI0033D669C1
MRYGAALAAIALTAVVNGIDTELLALWRQLAFLGLAALAYLHGRRLDFRWGAQVLLVIAALTALIAVVDLGEAVSATGVLLCFVMLPWFIGRYRRQQVALIRAGEERVARLERERTLVADRAQADERARIAADLHDSVGHDLALIALRAGALELSPGLQASEREAVAALRANAVEATDRLRQALGLLREGAAPIHPADEPVEALVERAAEAGLDVVFTSAAEPLEPMLDQAVYRIVQESLTNAAKHAPGGTVSIRIELEEDLIHITATNPTDPASPQGNGSGLPALAERVRLLGGTFTAGSQSDLFVLHATMPKGGTE